MRHACGRSATRVLLLRTSLSIPACVLVGCAHAIPEVDPADIPRLEIEIAADPNDTDLQVQLGMAQFEAGDFQSSLATLQAAVDAGADSGPALLYLGMVQEELQDWSAARAAYTQYLTVGTSGALREEVRRRLTLIGRNVLRAQAAEALAREAEIASTDAATPRSVAVFPFGFNSSRADLEPLIYALSDMMITDFSVSNALVVLERVQIQTLLDEMALTTAGYAEPTTGARAGRLLSAEHVVQGVLTTLREDDLQTEADVLNVPGSTSAGRITEEAALEGLFDMEKQIVIRTIREVLGIVLTPAEEQAILENRVDNVLAFLSYGRGLRELDRGNYEAAQAEFQQAVQLSPGGYPAAEDALTRAGDLLESSAFTTNDVARLAAATGEIRDGALATSRGFRLPTASALLNAAEAVDPTPTTGTLELLRTQRDPVQEARGQEIVTGSAEAQIRLVIQRPGGGP